MVAFNLLHLKLLHEKIGVFLHFKAPEYFAALSTMFAKLQLCLCVLNKLIKTTIAYVCEIGNIRMQFLCTYEINPIG